jgi:hypothetical protein
LVRPRGYARHALQARRLTTGDGHRTGRGEADSRDATRWCVGLTIDPKFWSQKGPDNAGLGRISRANLESPAGQTAATRSDIEIFFDGLPEPIDLELDQKSRVLYWTDRGNLYVATP